MTAADRVDAGRERRKLARALEKALHRLAYAEVRHVEAAERVAAAEREAAEIRDQLDLLDAEQ